MMEQSDEKAQNFRKKNCVPFPTLSTTKGLE